MRKLWHLIACTISALIALQCSGNPSSSTHQPPRQLSSAETALVGSTNEFGFSLFGEIVEDQPDDNIFISPLSVSMALAMAYNGAGGETKDAMEATLALTGMDIQQINESYQSLIDLLINLDPDVTFQIANSMWYYDWFPVSRDFTERISAYFYAAIRGLDFSSPDAADIINAWVNESTNGKIPDIVDSPIDPYTVMFLINAIYFNANWTYQFDETDTHEAMFNLPDGSQIPCQMMFQENEFKFLMNSEFQAVKLPYGNELYSMVIFLPRVGRDVNEFIAGLDVENWEDWLNSFFAEQGTLSMPKYSLEYEISLKDVLTALGMGIAFDPSAADFLGLTEPGSSLPGNLYISKVKHKTFIKVDEAGTEAAAATSVEFGCTSSPPGIFINRPFVFMILENHSNTILFMGKIVEPVSG